jgi:hypothetical protein
MAVSSLAHVGGWSGGFAILACKASTLFPLGPTSRNPFGWLAIIRKLDVGQACAVHDTNSQQVQNDLIKSSLARAKQHNPGYWRRIVVNSCEFGKRVAIRPG